MLQRGFRVTARTRKESGRAPPGGSIWPTLGGSGWVTLPGSRWATPGGSASPTPVAQYGVTADTAPAARRGAGDASGCGPRWTPRSAGPRAGAGRRACLSPSADTASGGGGRRRPGAAATGAGGRGEGAGRAHTVTSGPWDRSERATDTTSRVTWNVRLTRPTSPVSTHSDSARSRIARFASQIEGRVLAERVEPPVEAEHPHQEGPPLLGSTSPF